MEYLQRDDAQFTTQFTCFTSTKVQTLTPEEQLTALKEEANFFGLAGMLTYADVC